MDANSQLEPSIIEIIPNQTVSKKICKTTYELLKKMCNLIFQHTLMIYMLFNGILLFLLVSKNLNSHLLVYLWMFSSLFLFVFKLYEFLQQARVNEVRSFQILENLPYHDNIIQIFSSFVSKPSIKRVEKIAESLKLDIDLFFKDKLEGNLI